jgi:dTDP-4-dehydrorhamnose 3,5-epimerase
MTADATRTEQLDGLALIVPERFSDDRGHFFEAYSKSRFSELTGFDGEFLQDNQSYSNRGVLRGLHYQIEPRTQGKLIRAISGVVFDVTVDIRGSSSTLGQWFGVELSAEDGTQLWIPPGFAHGFLALSETAEVLYKVTEIYSPEHERTIRWDDPSIGIEWPIEAGAAPIVSDGDAHGELFADATLLP